MMSLPKNEKMLLIRGITRVAHTPRIVEGKTSGTGRTVAVEQDGKTVRLDTKKLLKGGLEVRGAQTYELYTRDRFIRARKNNSSPTGGRHRKLDEGDLPEQTHAIRD